MHPAQETTLAGAQRLVASALSDHRLALSEDAPVALEMRTAHVGALSLLLLRYGAAVAIEPCRLAGHLLFQVVLRGELQVEHAGGSFHGRAGDAVLIEDLADKRLKWSRGSQQLIMRLPRGAITRAMGEAVAPVKFDSVFSLSEGRTGTLELIRYIMTQANAGRLVGMDTTVMDLLVRQLLAHHSNFERAGASLPRCVYRAESHMRANLGEDMTLAELADAAQTTSRTLASNFQRFRGVSPMTRFRDLRLDAARAALLDGTASSVTDAAMTFRFFHLGRFSQSYRDRFGEMPSATQLRDRSYPAPASAYS